MDRVQAVAGNGSASAALFQLYANGRAAEATVLKLEARQVYPRKSCSASGNSLIELSNSSGRAARKLFSVGKRPSTAMARTPVRRAISRSSGESPTYTQAAGRKHISLRARR